MGALIPGLMSGGGDGRWKGKGSGRGLRQERQVRGLGQEGQGKG